MANGLDLFFLLNTGISWLIMVVILAGLAVSLANQRISPMMWLVSFGFIGLLAGGVWNRLGVPLIAKSGMARETFGYLLLIGSLVHLISWIVLVSGLFAVFTELRRRLFHSKDPIDKMF